MTTPSGSQDPSAWKDALEAVLAPSDHDPPAPDQDRQAPQAGLEFDLTMPVLRRVRSQRREGSAGAPYTLGIRPVRRGARGQWVHSRLDWERAVDAPAAGLLDEDQADWFDELRALASVRSRHPVHDRHWIRLEHYESPTLWQLLARAPDLGIELVGAEHGLPVTITDPGRLQIDLTRDEQGDLRMHPRLVIGAGQDERELPLTSAGIVGQPGHGLFFPVEPEQGPPEPDPRADADADLNRFPLRLVPLATRLTRDQRRFLETSRELTVPADEVREFAERWFPRLHHRLELTSADDSFELPEVADPEMVLTVAHDDLTVRLEWEWEYQLGSRRQRLPFRPHDPLGTEPVTRESTWESAMTTAVTRRIPDLDFRRSAYVGQDAVVLLREWLPQLEQVADLRIETTGTAPAYQQVEEAPEITVSTAPSSRRDWFDLGVTIRVGQHYVAFADVFRALAQGQDVMMLPDGTWFELDAPRFVRLRELLREARDLDDSGDGPPQISRHQVGLWDELEELADRSEPVRSWREAVSRLTEQGPARQVPVPEDLQAELRPYQLEGFRWLCALRELGLGGVLADDMGLGKTVQTIAMMLRARQPGAPSPWDHRAGPDDARRPFLVVAPTSVVPNWVSELRRFAPELSVAAAPGTAAATGVRAQELAAQHDVVVVSYTLLRLDQAHWTAVEWDTAVLDEAQAVKNPRTQAHKAARALPAGSVIAVTGTPLENGLSDLWALLALTAPGLFPSRRRFTETYLRPIEDHGDQQALARMRRRAAPFLLRRTKDSVDLQLPPKLEQTLTVQLSEQHRRLYDTRLQRERTKVLGLLQDVNGNRFTIFRSLTALRLMALDPSLVDPELEADSSKLDVLFEHLPELIAEGHRPLVFSQFTGFLKLAAARLEQAGIPYAYLDGSTRDRAGQIERFRSGQAPVFLVSLKAGGTGLNLVEADYCFLLDPWWNPMAEAQAVDRAHRIGQQRRVMVYRLVAAGTIEEKVMRLKERKSRLIDAVMDDDGAFAGSLDAQDLAELFAV